MRLTRESGPQSGRSTSSGAHAEIPLELLLRPTSSIYLLKVTKGVLTGEVEGGDEKESEGEAERRG